MKTVINYIRSLFLWELLKGLRLTGSYMLKGSVTLQYPEEKAPVSPRFRGLHALRRYEMVKSVVSLVNYVRRCVLR